MDSVTSQLLTAGVVPIFSHASAEVSLNVVQACYRAGLRVFEYTNRHAQAFDTFCQLVAARPTTFPDMLLGIGTVFEPDTAQRFIDAGAQFVVAPIMNPAVGRVCQERSVPWLPGCQTITEVYHALAAGADIIKIFPGDVVGPALVKAVRSVLPPARLMVTGGVEPTRASLTTWYRAGAVGVGMGSQLFPKDVVAQNDMAAIEQTAATARALWAELSA